MNDKRSPIHLTKHFSFSRVRWSSFSSTMISNPRTISTRFTSEQFSRWIVQFSNVFWSWLPVWWVSGLEKLVLIECIIKIDRKIGCWWSVKLMILQWESNVGRALLITKTSNWRHLNWIGPLITAVKQDVQFFKSKFHTIITFYKKSTKVGNQRRKLWVNVDWAQPWFVWKFDYPALKIFLI